MRKNCISLSYCILNFFFLFSEPLELEEYKAFLNWLNTKQQERLAACKVILNGPAFLTKQSDLICAANLQRRPFPPFQLGIVYEGLGEREVWNALQESQNAHEAGGSNVETPAVEVGAKPIVKVENFYGDIIEIDDSD